MFKILKLTRRIRAMRKKHKEICIFVDFKSAYYSVNRILLFEIARDKKVLSPDELNFIQRLYFKLNVNLDGEKIYFENGVPKGPVLSPFFFNIYAEELVKGG